MTDTRVGCTTCGREQGVDFGRCLGSGWPKCCGYTMRMMSCEADIEAVMAAKLAPVAAFAAAVVQSKGDPE